MYKFGKQDFENLLQLAREGDQVAIGEILQQYRKYLLSVASRELDRDIKAKFGASDIVQESLLTAHQNFRQFKGDDGRQLLAWLRQFVINDMNHARRKFKGTQKRQISRERTMQLQSSFVRPILDNEFTPQTNAIAHEGFQQLRKAMSNLPEDYRQVIQLHNFDGKEFEEIAQVMHRSVEAVRKLWTRAVIKLRQKLDSVSNPNLGPVLSSRS